MSLTPTTAIQPIRFAETKETTRMTMIRALDVLASILIVVLAVGTGVATAFLSA